MKRRIEVEVEPLTPSRWSKVDAGLFAELDRERDEAPTPPRAVPFARRRAVVVAAAGFAAAAAFAAVAGRTLFQGAPPMEASRIVTGASPSHVALGASSLEVGPESAVVASGDDERGRLVVLEKGTVDCEVAERKGRPPFVVLAGDVRVRVVGTRFVVERAPEGVRVRVNHGTVEVLRGGVGTLLHDGERWSEPRPAEVVTPSAPPPSAAPEVPTAKPEPSAKPARPTVAPSAPHDPASDQKAFERAASLEVRDPEAALATYRRLGGASGPWAAPALFAAGRLAADRGRSAEARALLGDYLRRFPGGSNAADARKLLGDLR